VVEAHGLVKSWGATSVLTGVDFVVGRGVTGLLGSNGAGKTTLLGMILGLHRADAGELDVFGLDPSAAGPEVRALLGYSPEHHTLPPDVRAHDLVRHIAELHGLPHRDATNRASDALWAVGLGEERFRPIGTMSTGQRQRVKLAQAIAHDPQLVLLDEPTVGLDPVQRDQMLELIRRCGTEFGIDVLLSSHLLEEVERVCDSVVILRDGVVAANGSINELRGMGHGVTVDIDGDPRALADELARRDVPCRLDATHVLVDSEDDRTLDAIRDTLADLGLPLRSLTPRRRSLEDVFLGRGEEHDVEVGVACVRRASSIAAIARTRAHAAASAARC
jgi:ABC-2 type transport system ATP-binding protein